MSRRIFIGGLAASALATRASGLRGAAVSSLATGPVTDPAAPRPGGPSAAGNAVALRPDARAPQRESLVMAAMGELRREYDDALLRDVLGSGMDSITVTLCDPKFEGAQALATAIDGWLDYDRLIAERPERLLKATTVADVDRARREGKLAVF